MLDPGFVMLSVCEFLASCRMPLHTAPDMSLVGRAAVPAMMRGRHARAANDHPPTGLAPRPQGGHGGPPYYSKIHKLSA